jgi:type IV secretion system protein VirB8
MFATLGSVLVIAKLTPLKSVEPFVIQIDPKSGITQTVDPMTAEEISGNEAVHSYFLVQYIRSREGYSMQDLKRNYPTVRLMSENLVVYPQFVRESDPSNPRSNTARLGTTGTRTVHIKSLTYLEPNKAQARLLIEETTASGSVMQYHKIAVITFKYEKLALTTEERYINPLGFRVMDYRVDEETISR